MVFGAAGVRPASAQGGDTITVNGVGTASGTPDIATVEIGFESLANQLQNAFNTSNQNISNITKALIGAGVQATDIQKVVFTISPVDRVQAGNPTGNFQFRIRQVLRVIVRDVGKADATVTAAIAAGANIVQNFAYALDQADEAEGRAREAAMKNARARANQAAAALGVAVSDVVNVVENVVVAPVIPIGNGSRSTPPGESEVTGNVGQIIVTVNVTVTFTLRSQA
jgi:hypothetical protein